ELAHAEIDELLADGATPIVVGGTGLYLRAALADLELPPPPEPGTRERFDAMYEELGPEGAHSALAARDPAAAARIHPNDRRRVVRALELAEAGESLAPTADSLWGESYRHPTLVVALDVPREVLAGRIEARTSSMVERGVVDEARAAFAHPISRTASTIHGLRDFAELPREQAVETYNRRVRRYAAYQRKWMRRIPGVVIIDANRPATEVADEIVELARARERLPGDGAVRADA
ncbi:MAG TPA: tRNA dimethylallyltransferase, partial [Gaiellaceae bacterium]|nr:tRNA dimethylallyltransferase [Gaiellaceae bacterium]